MIKQVIVVRKDLNMRKGKIAAQVAHASMSFIVKGAEIEPVLGGEFVLLQTISRQAFEWLSANFVKIVASVNSQAELEALIEKGREAGLDVHPIWDNGLTEFHGVSTLTCAAFGPDEVEKVDAVTRGLPLL